MEETEKMEMEEVEKKGVKVIDKRMEALKKIQSKRSFFSIFLDVLIQIMTLLVMIAFLLGIGWAAHKLYKMSGFDPGNVLLWFMQLNTYVRYGIGIVFFILAATTVISTLMYLSDNE